MKRIFLSVILIAFYSNQLFSQTLIPAIKWEKSIGSSNSDEAKDVIQSGINEYIVVGGFDNDLTITKFDSLGNIIWDKTYGGTNFDNAESIDLTSDGNYIIAGTSSSINGDVTGNNGGKDMWLLKIDVNGDLLWNKCYGFQYHDEYAYSVKETSDNGFIIAGTRSVSGIYGYNTDYYIVKVNSVGDTLWTRSFGDEYNNIARSVTELNDGSLVFTGTNHNITYNLDVLNILRLSSNGDSLWSIDQQSTGAESNGYSVEASPDGEFIVVGNYGSGSGFVTKFNHLDGTEIWNAMFGGSNSDGFTSIKYVSDNNYIIAGYSISDDNNLTNNNGQKDFWLTKVNDHGLYVNLLWSKSLGGSDDDIANSAIETSDGKFIIVGESMSDDYDVSSNNGWFDKWIVMLDFLPPEIVQNSADTSICENGNVSLFVNVAGSEPISYKWFLNDTIISGAINNELLITNFSTLDTGIYKCVAINNLGSDTTYINVSYIAPFAISFTTVSPIITGDSSLITYTGPVSGNDIFYWNFDNPIENQSGLGPHNISWSSLGSKVITLTIINENSCISQEAKDTVIVNPDFSIQNEVCLNSNTQINCLDTSSAIYSWDFDNGNVVSGSEQGPYEINWDISGIKNVTINAEKDGYIYSTTKSIFVNDLPEITASDDTLICKGEIVNIGVLVNDTNVSYYWSNQEITDSITVSPLNTTNYIVTVTDLNNCSNTDTSIVNVSTPYQDQQICIVSVDPLVGKNKIIWQKTENVGIESYLIQKEISTNIYSIIGIVSAIDTNEFIDYGSDPMSHSDLYKITIKDTCGNYSDINNSMYHKTINLGLSNVGSTMYLDWEQYEVEDGSFIPFRYYIYRGVTPDNLQLIDSVTGNIHSYNDVGVSQIYYYMVGLKRENCDNNKSIKSISYEAFSNIKDNEDIITNLNNNESQSFKIFPNPSENIINFYINNESKNNFNISIYNSIGEKVKSILINNISDSYQIDISNLKPGIYTVIINLNTIYKSKFIKK